MSRHLNISYKTAFVLCHKLREALFKTRDLSPLQGEIHEDGKPVFNEHGKIAKGKNYFKPELAKFIKKDLGND